MTNTLTFLIDTLGGLYVMAILLRFLLQLVRADFYNPLSQAIVKITGPLLNPLRRLIPGYRGIDIASLVLAFLIQTVIVYLLLATQGYMPDIMPVTQVLLIAGFKLLSTLLNIYMFSLIIIAIASWVAPGNYNPALTLMLELTEPLSRRIRRVIPPMGGLDFSLMILVLAIVILKNALPSLLPGL